jgi:hypothetical protein
LGNEVAVATANTIISTEESHPRKRMGSTAAGENKKAPKAPEAEAPPSTAILEAALEESLGETHREKE